MNTLTKILILAALTFTIEVKGQLLSNKAETSVLIIGPYQSEVFSAFCHSAIWVSDPVNRLDVVFDYGVYDFEQPNFYLKFALGNPYFKLGKQSGTYFINSAIEENRSIVQQQLNLNQQERQRILDFLNNNALPENCNFYYNYLYDNCATRIRDVFDSLFFNKVEYDYSYGNLY